MAKTVKKYMNNQPKKAAKKTAIKSAKGKIQKKKTPTTIVKKDIKKKQVTKKPASKNNVIYKNEKIKKDDSFHNIESENVLETTEQETPKEEVVVVSPDIAELEKKKKTYWSDETEKAVVDFLNSDCNYFQLQLERYFEDCKKTKKNPDIDFVNNLQEKYELTNNSESEYKKAKIYKDHIHKPLNRLVENIIFNFKLFRPGIEIKTLQTDCLSFVYGKFCNFNPDQNTKSFSFFGTIAKHYLMGEKKETDKSYHVNLDYDDHKEEADGREIEEPGVKSDLDTSFQLFSHITNSLEAEIQKKINNPNEKKGLSENDLKVADAIVNIFKNHELLGAYNKAHIYHLIKEYTGLQTKDITYSLARFRTFYKFLKQDFIKQNINKD